MLDSLMHQVPHEHVLELRAATDTSSRTGGIDPLKYKENLGYLQRRKMPDVHYLFSLPEGWDVLEVTRENDEYPVLRKDDKDLHIGKIDPSEHGTVVRTLILTPVNAEAETRALLGLPRWDRYIRIIGLLSDDDRYLPLAAEYTGAYDAPVDAAKLAQDTLAILSSPEFRAPVEVPAPVLPSSESIARWRTELIAGSLDHHRRQLLVGELMAMDEESFIEAISWLLPILEQNNTWLVSHPQVAERAWAWNQDHPEYEGSITTAPWKTGRMLPRNYYPRVAFNTPVPVSPQAISF